MFSILQSDPRDFHEMKMPDGQTVLRVPPHYAQLAAALGLNSQMEPVVGAAAAGSVNSTMTAGNCVITPTDFENLIELHRKQHRSPHGHLGGEQIGETAEHRCTRTDLPAPSTPAPAMCVPAWDHYPKSSSSSPPLLPPTHQQQQHHHHSPLEYHQRQQSMSPAIATMLPPPSVENNMEINENKLHSQNIIDTMDVDVDGDVDDDEEQQASSSPSRPHQSTPSPSTPPPSTPSLHQPSSHSIISDGIVVEGSAIEVGVNNDNGIVGNVGELDCDGKTTMVIPYDNSYTSSPQPPSSLASQTLAVAKKNSNSSTSYSFGEGLKENRIYEQNQNNQNLLNQNCDPNVAQHQHQQQQQHQAYMHSMHHHHSHHLNPQQIDENMWRPW